MEQNSAIIQNEKTKPREEVRESKHPLWAEMLIEACLCVVVSLIGPLFLTLPFFETTSEDIIELTYSANLTLQFSKSLILVSLISGAVAIAVLILLLCLFKPSGLEAKIGKKGKYLICLIILSVFGLLANVVIANILYSILKAHRYLILFVSMFIVGIYEVLIYKLYLEGRTNSNHLFWEIFRFAIVGLVAAVFDFLTCYVVQFILFKDNTAGYVTIIATACGFAVGVVINYLMSTYMVYKASKSGLAKSFKGMVAFLILSIIGLLIGMAIQYVLYDILYVQKEILIFSYPVDFVIRTLIVMVYNYISRKLIIYRK